MDDNTDIAFLAASVEREMRSSLAGSSGLKYNRTDFRRFLPNGQQIPQQQNPQYIQQQHHQQQAYPPQYVQPPSQPQYHNPQNNPVDYYIPEGVLPPPQQQLIPLPPSYSNQNQQPPESFIQNTDSFKVPDYTKQKQYLEDEQEFRDALIQEIKEQKKSINKLKKDMSKLILLVEQLTTKLNPETSISEPIINNDTTDKS